MIIDQVKNIIASKLSLDVSTLNEKTNILEDLKADSILLIEIMIEIEDEFNIEINDEDVNRIKTIGDLVNRIEKSMD